MARVFNHSQKIESKIFPEAWGTMEWLADEVLIPGANMSVALMTLKPGQSGVTHRHSNCHEFIYLIQGTVEQKLDDRKIRLVANDSVFIPLGTAHSSTNTGSEDARMVISYSEGKRIYEKLE
jgi:mannose-6-phosphate isomerase-like protein (cupin superfamily)